MSPKEANVQRIISVTYNHSKNDDIHESIEAAKKLLDQDPGEGMLTRSFIVQVVECSRSELVLKSSSPNETGD